MQYREYRVKTDSVDEKPGKISWLFDFQEIKLTGNFAL